MPFLPLLAGLDPLAAAALITALVIGVSALVIALAEAFAAIQIPVVGKWISAAFRALTKPMVNALTQPAVAHAPTIESWVRQIAYIGTGMARDIKSLFSLQAGLITYLYRHAIPQASSVAQNTAAAYANQETIAIRRDIANATRTIEGVASGDAARALAKAEGFAGTVKADLTRLVAHDLTVGERYTDQKVGALRRHVDGLAGVRGETGAQGAQGEAGVAGAATYLPLIPAIPGVTDVPTSLVAGVVAVGTAVAAITSEFERCGVRSCAGPNNLSNLLNDVLGFAGLAELGVFLNQAISHPAAAEQEYANVFAGLVRPLTTGGGDIWAAIESVLAL